MNSIETQYGKPFEGLGSHVKLAGLMLNPLKILKQGWKANEEGYHFATPEKLRGWVGGGNMIRHLPVGFKTLTAAGIAAEAPSAFAKEDKSGEGKGRGERIGQFVAGSIGGIASNLPRRYGFLPQAGAAIAGGLGASMVGSRIGRMFDRPKTEQ